jgi:hypothetical protein
MGNIGSHSDLTSGRWGHQAKLGRGRVSPQYRGTPRVGLGEALRNKRITFCGAIATVVNAIAAKPAERGERRQQRRAANRRYQRTEPGKQAHRLRQRAYRRRQRRPHVTDQSSRSITTPGIVNSAGPPKCSICGYHAH